MNYKTILVGVLLAGSMQSVWGMENEGQNANGQSSTKEISDTARLAAAMEQLNLTLQAGFINLGAALDNQTKKLDNLAKVQMIMTHKMVDIGNRLRNGYDHEISHADFSKITEVKK